MRIRTIRATPTVSGFYTDDQAAIKAGAERDGFDYRGEPRTAGFTRVRQAGEALSVELDLGSPAGPDRSLVAHGDCCAVQYSGAGGRDPPFFAGDHRSTVEGPVADNLRGRDAAAFRENAALLEAMRPGGDRLHTAVRYGVSQALLHAAALARGTTMTDVLADEFDLDPATEPIPVFGQSGDERRRTAEKMLLKRTPVLPHGLFNSAEAVGEDGSRLREYLAWLADRADEAVADAAAAGEAYEPRFHVDVYGTLGDLFGPPYDRAEVVDYLADLRAAAAPYPLQVEGPMDEGGRAEQIHAMCELREGLADAGVAVDVVADEWCDTLEDVRAFVDAGAADLVQVKTPDLGGVDRSVAAVLACEGTDTRAYLGGTCNETDRSARVCAHVALATDAAQTLAKPGMGFDEGYMVVENEMRRTVTRRADRRKPGSERRPGRTPTAADGGVDR
ncbi:methylaspartate ammonia-lyase [Halobium salinum]|uniref:methylaspartate ammonia-lyase n=1 Tax=Halobium salinum TaxID=1364940 RepID=A0ABD5PE66_9EURY|nr:methylaspartate ammonia-lyase [Halobium salinum]